MSLVMRSVTRNATICTAGGHNLDSEDDQHQVSSGTNIRTVLTREMQLFEMQLFERTQVASHLLGMVQTTDNIITVKYLFSMGIIEQYQDFHVDILYAS